MSLYLNLINISKTVVFVYDIMNKDTFQKIHVYMEMVKKSHANPQLVLLGNKLDLDRKSRNEYPVYAQREVSFGDGLKYAIKHNMAFYEYQLKAK